MRRQRDEPPAHRRRVVPIAPGAPPLQVGRRFQHARQQRARRARFAGGAVGQGRGGIFVGLRAAARRVARRGDALGEGQGGAVRHGGGVHGESGRGHGGGRGEESVAPETTHATPKKNSAPPPHLISLCRVCRLRNLLY
jgi:hypothetical protein